MFLEDQRRYIPERMRVDGLWPVGRARALHLDETANVIFINPWNLTAAPAAEGAPLSRLAAINTRDRTTCLLGTLAFRLFLIRVACLRAGREVLARGNVGREVRWEVNARTEVVS